MVNCPRLLVRETRVKDCVVKALSAKSAYSPTSIPLIGSRFSASNNVPETSIVSISEPVEKAYVKLPMGFPSLLSTMASEKSTV